jgi:hypothetical protein
MTVGNVDFNIFYSFEDRTEAEPKSRNLEDYLSLFIFNVKSKTDLYSGKCASRPLILVMSDIVDTESALFLSAQKIFFHYM